MTQEQYDKARKIVFEKFDEEFLKKYYLKDAAFHNIVEMLIRGTDPYDIIEFLIEERIKMFDLLNLHK